MLFRELWKDESRKLLICVDSYEGNVPKGRLYGPDQCSEAFGSLSQLLVLLEEQLDRANGPRGDTQLRTFSTLLQTGSKDAGYGFLRRGICGTFELHILFRQHSSWQGTLRWCDQNRECSFRSVLELILLMDSALRPVKGGDG